MDYLIVATVCFAGGGFAMYVALDVKRRRLEQLRLQQESRSKDVQDRLREIQFQGQKVSQDTATLLNARQEFDKRVVSHTKSCKMKTDCSKPIYEILR